RSWRSGSASARWSWASCGSAWPPTAARRTCARCWTSSTRSATRSPRSRCMPPPWTTSSWRSPMSDAITMSGRALRLSRRTVEAVLTSLMLPIMLMLLFVYLFGGAIETGTAKYVTYVVPGLLLLCAGYGASVTAVSVSHDMGSGIVDRFRSLDVGGASVLAGHVTASVVRNAASTVLVLGVGLLVGFRPNASAVDWVAAAGVLALFVLALSWFA